MAVEGGPHTAGRGEVERLMAEGAVVLEVLEREQYDRAHLPAARHFPLASMDRGGVVSLDRHTAVVVYCNDFL